MAASDIPTVVSQGKMMCPVCRQTGNIKVLTYVNLAGCKIYRHLDGNRQSCVPALPKK